MWHPTAAAIWWINSIASTGCKMHHKLEPSLALIPISTVPPKAVPTVTDRARLNCDSLSCTRNNSWFLLINFLLIEDSMLYLFDRLGSQLI